MHSIASSVGKAELVFPVHPETLTFPFWNRKKYNGKALHVKTPQDSDSLTPGYNILSTTTTM